MNSTNSMGQPLPDPSSRLIALLEHHRGAFPQLDDELAQQQRLAHTLAEQRQHSERALAAWRSALSRRWECEVQAQRAYSSVQRQLNAHYGSDAAYAQLIAPARPGGPSTPSELLHHLRRLEAALKLLMPQPPFAALALAELRAISSSFEQAIDATTQCETERRRLLTEQRIAANLYEQAYDRARRLLAHFVGEQTLALPPLLSSEASS
jgi:chromosome segregation ATPase